MRDAEEVRHPGHEDIGLADEVVGLPVRDAGQPGLRRGPLTGAGREEVSHSVSSAATWGNSTQTLRTRDRRVDGWLRAARTAAAARSAAR